MKNFFLIAIFQFVAVSCFAQWGEEDLADQASWRDRVFTGGGFGLSFGSNIDFISLSPLIGYRITPKFAAGASIIYQRTNYKFLNPRVSTNNYGASPFLRYNIFNNIFLHSEYEYMNYEFPISANESQRKAFTSFFAGGGFFQPIGRNAGIFAMALYNFSYRNPTSANSFQPYDSPLVIRAGITAGF